MKICIFGAGAGGGHMAVRLARAGHDVSAVARGEQLAAIRRNGLRLLSGADEFTATVAASDNPADLGPQDLVVVAVKATALPEVAATIGPLVGAHTRILFAQNGMQWWYPLGQDDLPGAVREIPVFALASSFLRHMEPRQVLGGVLYTANAVQSPGVILNTSPTHNRIYFAPVVKDGGDATVAELRSAFSESGILSLPVEDVRERVWKKLIFNMSSSAIALVTGNMSSVTRTDPELAEVFGRIVHEANAVAAAYGHELQDEMVPEQMLTVLLDHKPSILQDYEMGRRMEIAEILLAPLAMARAAQVPVPTLQTIAAIAARLARDRGLLPLDGGYGSA